MNLQENIFRLRELMMLNELIDIPVKKSGDTETPDRGPSIDISKQDNRVIRTFKGDFLKIREFIQNLFPNQNLKYLGSGAIGLAMTPKGGLSLPPSFTDSNFVGSLPPSGTEIVLKFTTNVGEANKIKNWIENYGGQVPGVVSYYWIKEVELPNEIQWSSTLGAPPVSKTFATKEERFDDFAKRFDNEFFKKDHPELNTDEKLKKYIKKMYDNFIELKKKKNEVKREKLYIIALDKIESVSPDLKNSIRLAFDYYWWLQWQHNKENVKGYRQPKPIGVITNVYTKLPIMKKWYDKFVEEQSVSKNKIEEEIPKFETFKNTFMRLIKAIELIWSGPVKKSQLDLHDGNVGLRNGDLVFFDVFT